MTRKGSPSSVMSSSSDRDAGRVADLVRDVSLAQEALADDPVAREIRVEDLERRALAVPVRRRVHRGHPADAEQRVEVPLASDCRPDARRRAVVRLPRDALRPAGSSAARPRACPSSHSPRPDSSLSYRAILQRHGQRTTPRRRSQERSRWRNASGGRSPKAKARSAIARPGTIPTASTPRAIDPRSAHAPSRARGPRRGRRRRRARLPISDPAARGAPIATATSAAPSAPSSLAGCPMTATTCPPSASARTSAPRSEGRTSGRT